MTSGRRSAPRLVAPALSLMLIRMGLLDLLASPSPSQPPVARTGTGQTAYAHDYEKDDYCTKDKSEVAPSKW